jgi:glucose/arabinose dehydrogenase
MSGRRVGLMVAAGVMALAVVDCAHRAARPAAAGRGTTGAAGGGASAAPARPPTGGLPLERIALPKGFYIGLYARADGAREMTLGPEGTVFVGSIGTGKVYALLPSADRTEARRVVTIASGLDWPNGVAFRDGSLYVAEVTRIIRYDDIMARLDDPPRPVVVSDSFPRQTDHGWKFIAFGPDGMLYVPVGAPFNVGIPRNPLQATIARMRPDGSGLEVYARGVRNTVGFDWDPRTKELWFTDNGRDYLGDNLPPDELNHAPRPGMNFGFPYCYGQNVPDPQFGKGHDCSKDTPAAMDLGPHVASLGMRFYTGSMFPSEYRNQVFIAEHGSWNRSVPIGYRVSTVRLQGGKPVSYRPFAQGWLQGREAWGRPVDVLVMPDGALLVSDDRVGAVYRIGYRGSGVGDR